MTIIEKLALFGHDARFADLPRDVVDQSKRLLLDSLGCALAAHDTLKGRAGVELALEMGGASDDATIFGGTEGASTFGAAFANGELINALDFDSILPPGHVTPYVLPGLLAVGERLRVDGRSLITSIAVAHEISLRMGKAMDNLRDVEDGKPAMPAVFGYSSTVFGATAAIGRLMGLHADAHAHALSIAGTITPVNAFRAWCMRTPPTTLKYLSAGALSQAAMTAAHMARSGHIGNLMILDDAEFGFRRYIGTRRWETRHLLDGLGEEWNFPGELSYKPYPHARGSHGALDALTRLVAENDLKPEEIEAVRAWGETFAATYPVWQNRDIVDVHDAQYSIVHALAMGAHRVPPGRAWQDPQIVLSQPVLKLMDRISYQAHKDYAQSITTHPGSRPTRVEIDARGTTFVGECTFPKGSPSPDAATTMSTADLMAKFRANAHGTLRPSAIHEIADMLLTLETAADVSVVLRRLTRAAQS